MIETIEAPGGAGLKAVCPHCGKSDYDEKEYPKNCKRCSAPMDVKAAKQWAEGPSGAEV